MSQEKVTLLKIADPLQHGRKKLLFFHQFVKYIDLVTIELQFLFESRIIFMLTYCNNFSDIDETMESVNKIDIHEGDGTTEATAL